MQESSLGLPTLGHLIAATRRRIKLALWAQLQPLGLTPQQFWVLLIVGGSDGLSLHDLAQQVWMDDPTASRVVKGLSSRDLLTSAPDPNHGRRRVIQLGPEGRRLQPILQDLATSFRAHMECGITPQAEAHLRRDLERILFNMDALEGCSLLTSLPSN